MNKAEKKVLLIAKEDATLEYITKLEDDNFTTKLCLGDLDNKLALATSELATLKNAKETARREGYKEALLNIVEVIRSLGVKKKSRIECDSFMDLANSIERNADADVARLAPIYELMQQLAEIKSTLKQEELWQSQTEDLATKLSQVRKQLAKANS